VKKALYNIFYLLGIEREIKLMERVADLNIIIKEGSKKCGVKRRNAKKRRPEIKYTQIKLKNSHACQSLFSEHLPFSTFRINNAIYIDSPRDTKLLFD
jgi:hypothetical protein